MNSSDAVIAYARTFLGVPYVYGGNNRLTGMDCSGFVCEVLRSFGLIGLHEDLSAKEIFNSLKKSSQQVGARPITPGAILFFGSISISHVAISVDCIRMIEAGGGDENCISAEIAKTRGAMVRESMIRNRLDLCAALLPAYPSLDVC